MLADLVALIPTILGFVVLYFVVKAAVVKGMEIAAWRVEPSIPYAVRRGMQEAFLTLSQEPEEEAETDETNKGEEDDG